MNKACFYVMTVDTGFAPNPFHGVCTLAACTPNHCKANLEEGDLIAGCFRSKGASKLVYVMQVEEELNLNDYWRDSRFACKKPSKNGTLIEQAGDNIYYKDRSDNWHQHRSAAYHKNDKALRQDTESNRVFIGKRFVYYGENAVDLPDEFAKFLPTGQGIKYLKDDSKDFAAFSIWAFDRPKLGRLGMPRDWKGTLGCGVQACRRSVGAYRNSAHAGPERRLPGQRACDAIA
jgi:hypothetical protein